MSAWLMCQKSSEAFPDIAHIFISSVMAAFMAAIHFPEAVQNLVGLWKMDGRDKPGHDG